MAITSSIATARITPSTILARASWAIRAGDDAQNQPIAPIASVQVNWRAHASAIASRSPAMPPIASRIAFGPRMTTTARLARWRSVQP